VKFGAVLGTLHHGVRAANK